MPQVQVIQPIQQQPKRLRVAAYARVSSKSANQLNSMSVQVEYYTDLIQKNPDWEFAGVYADEGISGTSLKNRTGFNHLMDDCRLGLIDRILVKSSSRMARNSVDFLSAVRELKSLGVALPHTPSVRSRLSHAANPRGTYSTCLSHHAQQADRKLHADFRPCPA